MIFENINQSWNEKFKGLVEHISTWSKDPSSKVAAIIVDADHNVRTVAYNGFPRGVSDTPQRLADRDVKYKMMVHAEANALSTCARLGISTKGAYIVCTHFPCSVCCGMIINAGIEKVIVKYPTPEFVERWGESLEISKMMFSEANIEIILL